jgi:hypothetical protein
VGEDCVARVWDAQTCMPLSPRIQYPINLDYVRFCEHDRRLVAMNLRGDAWTYSLCGLECPVGDFAAFASVLSSVTSAQADHMRAQAKPNLLREWAALKAKYPSQFQVSDDAIMRWHQMQAECAEADKQWNGAVFHWNILLAKNPDDSQAKARLAMAKGHIAAEPAAQPIVHR